MLAVAAVALLPPAIRVVDDLLRRDEPIGARIGAILALALQQALVLYEAGSLSGFATLLLHAARGVRERLDEASDDALVRMTREELDRILTPDVAVTDATAEALAGSLFSACVHILQRHSPA